MSLFIAGNAFPGIIDLLDQAKAGILVASLSGRPDWLRPDLPDHPNPCRDFACRGSCSGRLTVNWRVLTIKTGFQSSIIMIQVHGG